MRVCVCFSVILYTVQLMSQTMSEKFLSGSQFHAVVSVKSSLCWYLVNLRCWQRIMDVVFLLRSRFNYYRTIFLWDVAIFSF